jgi:Tfp pilus assembly protein PilN
MPIDGSVRAVNLLPPDMAGASKASADLGGARPEATGGAGPFVLLGVLAACVAGVAGYVLTQNTIKQRQADFTAVTAQQQALAGKAEALRPFADFGTLANARVTTVKDLASSRFDWDQALRDLARAIPQDVTLKTLSGNVSGNDGGSVRGAISAPAITLDGCAPGQTQVARLMARLRGIDGVTRVSLSKSDVVANENAALTGTATERRNALPCGTGARPNFQVVAFFEKATNAAAAANPATSSASATASASPTPTATPATGGTATATATPSATPAGSGSSTTSTASTSQGGATP